MSPPTFLGSFKGNFKSPVSVRNWVVENVPCTKGPVPRDWTHAIYAKLRQSHVDSAVIVAGLTLARADGYVFGDNRMPINNLAGVPNPPNPNNGAQGAGPISESPREARKRAAEVLEWQFEKAKSNSNHGEMKRIAQQFADLLNSADPGPVSEEEMQWGAPLLREVVRARNADGSDPGPDPLRPRPTNGAVGWPYRPLYYVTGDVTESEGEAEAEAE